MRPQNKELKQTSVCPSFARAPGAGGALELAAYRQCSLDRWRCTERTWPAAAEPASVGACPRIAACAKRQQLIGKNPQPMRNSDNSGLQRAVSGVAEADVASLFSEARAGWPPLFACQGVHAMAEDASLFSEATARC
jgi:hypothetical protein